VGETTHQIVKAKPNNTKTATRTTDDKRDPGTELEPGYNAILLTGVEVLSLTGVVGAIGVKRLWDTTLAAMTGLAEVT
jgi:hypothetical protein